MATTETVELRSGSKMIKIFHACLGVVILTVAISHGSDNHESQDCRGASKALALTQTTIPSRTAGGSDPSTALPFKAHSVME
jgi:hypothetical protein